MKYPKGGVLQREEEEDKMSEEEKADRLKKLQKTGQKNQNNGTALAQERVSLDRDISRYHQRVAAGGQHHPPGG